MRKIILIIILSYSNFVAGQSNLSVIPSFCQSKGDVSNFDHKIELYKNDKLIAKEFYPINNFTVENLNKGKYLLKYETIFNQAFEREINLKKANESIKICIDDYLEIKKKTFIEELQANDTLEIWAYQTGCEYLDFGRLQLIKKGQNIEAILTQNNELVRKILSRSQLSLIEEIEQKIQLIKVNEENGYLRTFHYKIGLNGIEKVRTRYGVQVIGYQKKIREIFGN